MVETNILKKVLVELFTNSGCVNCPEANLYLDNISAVYADDMNIVRYHVNWTDPNDPMNLYNPTEVLDRVLYYSVFAVPAFVVDGAPSGTLNEADWSGRIAAASNETAQVYISAIDVVESIDSLHLEFELKTFGVNMTALTAWSLVSEDSIHFLGTNGEDLHMQVMRDMTSTDISALDNSMVIQQSLKKPADYGATGPMNLLIYVQGESDKAILQSRAQNLY